VDAVAPALRVARERGTAAVEADVRRLPFRDAACDLVLMADILEHLPPEDVPTALAEAARVLRPGGVALVNTSCYGLYLRRWLRRAPGGGRLDRDDLKDGHLNRFTAAELARAVREAGLKIEKKRYFKHLFQPLTALVTGLITGGRGEEEAAAGNKERRLRSPLARALNAGRIFIAGWDAFLFGWLPGGAVIYKLVK
jgi:SAM-dependent methyltransferase